MKLAAARHDFLVVDDSAADRVLIARILARRAPTTELVIREAVNAADAIAMVEERCPHCLILDLHLPGPNALALLHQLSVRFQGMPCPVVVVTGWISDDWSEQVLRAGAHDYILKDRLNELGLWSAVSYARTRFQLRRELEELNRELERKDFIKTEFVANATHELRTPLTAIVGLISLLQEEADPRKAREMVDTMAACCDSLLLSIDDILDLTKIEAGEFSLHPVSFDMVANLTPVVFALRPLAVLRGLELEMEIPDNLGPLWGDPRRVRQLIYNLVNNALKFTLKGSVALRVRAIKSLEDQLWLRFEVQDSGVGIAPADQARLFERHYQTGTRDFTSKGTGLGLAIVHSLATRMGGTVGLTSALGEGSTFWFELPFTVGKEPPSEKRSVAPRASESDGLLPGLSLRILVAEDNPIISQVVKRQLQNIGHVPTMTCNGLEAIEAFDAGSFDAVLLDARMPCLDGLGAATILRGRDRAGAAPLIIILMTAEAQIERALWRSAGVDECLIKPVSPAILRTVLARLIGDSPTSKVPT